MWGCFNVIAGSSALTVPPAAVLMCIGLTGSGTSLGTLLNQGLPMETVQSLPNLSEWAERLGLSPGQVHCSQVNEQHTFFFSLSSVHH